MPQSVNITTRVINFQSYDFNTANIIVNANVAIARSQLLASLGRP